MGGRLGIIIWALLFAAPILTLALLVIPFDWTEVRVQQAGLAALVLAIGWFTTFLLREGSAYLQKQERLRDFHRAIYAEIGANLFNLGSEQRLHENSAMMRTQMTEDADFVPFVPSERSSPVFDALAEHIHILPRVTIDPIVSYYSQVTAVAALASDMRGEVYAGLSPDRRIAIYADYIEMKVQALSYGDFALRMIAAYAEGGKKAARRLADELNSRAGDLSDP